MAMKKHGGYSEKQKREIRNTKKNLKTMSKNGSAHKVRSARRITKYGAVSFGRNIWLSIAAILVMTITLSILIVTVVAMNVLNATAEGMKEKIDITIFLNPGTSEEAMAEIVGKLEADPNVKKPVTAMTSKEVADQIVEKESEIYSQVESDEMYQRLVAESYATVRLNVYDIDNIESLKTMVATDPLFLENVSTAKQPTYDSDRTEIDTILSWANIAKISGLVLSAVFLGISVLVIFNTIRMAIFSRREEIYMMKLVGADDNFIRGPFLVEAQICGVISGIIAGSLGVVAFHYVEKPLADYGIDMAWASSVFHSNRVVLVYLIVIVLGMIIGTVSARLAVSKYLKK
ncbi:MAG: FtsX-like permease family protein [Candidatus Saccharibacteria bacterium]|nr:FtsX-like permease family protein [Candidatus Saccharibacteria bacterium]